MIDNDTTVMPNLIPFGWAPGNYMCNCHDCKVTHTADKRARRCYKCAIKMKKERDEINLKYDLTDIELDAIKSVQNKLYQQSADMGWHDRPKAPQIFNYKTVEEYVDALELHADTLKEKLEKSSIPVKLMLIVSEVAEAMEGDRKDLMDDHLPHRKMIEVELADAVIRILDLGGKAGLDIAGAIAEKHAYNRNRADHQKENREKAGGKTY